MRLKTAACLTIVFLFATTSVKAEAWDMKFGLGPFFGSEFDDGRKNGLGLQGYFDLGISESFYFTASGGYAWHFMGSGQEYQLLNLGAGLLYNIDVLVVVPFVSVKLGFLHQNFSSESDEESTSGMGVMIGFGLDYLATDRFTIGFAFEYQGMLSNLTALPNYLAFTARIGFRLAD